MARTSTSQRLLPTGSLAVVRRRPDGRRLTKWAKAGVFDALHLKVLDQLGGAGRLDWSRASVDTMSVRAKRGSVGANPVDRGKPGSSFTWSATVAGCR
jgi:hypothetical protein